MNGARLLAELAERKAEENRIRESLSVAIPVVHKDLPLVPIVTKWSGSDWRISLEFFSNIDSASLVGKWQESDCVEIASLKVTDSAKLFYQGCPELHKPEATWQKFKDTFRQRYKHVRTDQYHSIMLHTARKARNVDAQQFADRCKALSQKILCKSNEPVAQQIHQENAERMLVASYVTGLTGFLGKQVRIFNPQSIQQALQIAQSIQEAEKQEV